MGNKVNIRREETLIDIINSSYWKEIQLTNNQNQLKLATSYLLFWVPSLDSISTPLLSGNFIKCPLFVYNKTSPITAIHSVTVPYVGKTQLVTLVITTNNYSTSHKLFFNIYPGDGTEYQIDLSEDSATAKKYINHFRLFEHIGLGNNDK